MNDHLCLTVDANGLIRAWKDIQEATHARISGDTVVRLKLTAHQFQQLARAAQIAAGKKEVDQRGPHSGTSGSGEGY